MKAYWLVLFLLLPVVSAQYSYVEDADITTPSITSTSGVLELVYDKPSPAILNGSKYLVKHGENDWYNITLTNDCYYNSTSIRTRIVGEVQSAGIGGASSDVFCHNGASWVSIGNNYTNTLITGGSGSSSNSGLLSDGDYATGVFSNTGTWTLPGTSKSGLAATIYEEGIYWYEGTRQQVVFTVNNEFGRPVEDVSVSITRIADDYDEGVETTDVTGKVLYTLTQGWRYNISVSAGGYQNITGVINIIEQSYTLTLTVDRAVGSSYYGVFENITFITSPSEAVDAQSTNFSLYINDSGDNLDWWGVYSSFNGTVYNDNNTASGGGDALINVDLSDFENETILVTYYMKRPGFDLYQQNHYFIIGGINASNTSLTSLFDDNDGFSDFKKAGIAMIVLLFFVILLATAGVPGDWAAGIGGLFVLSIFLWTGWVDRVLAGISLMILVGWIVMSNRGGGA